jgi:stage III sporulation protein AH
VFTSATGVSSLAGAKLLKEQTRAQNKQSLLEIINSDELTEEAKKDAVNSMIALTENAQKESDAQMLLEAKGFTQAVVSISGDSVDVMVEAPSLSAAETAQIIDIVQRKTEIAAENIIITVSGAE